MLARWRTGRLGRSGAARLLGTAAGGAGRGERGECAVLWRGGAASNGGARLASRGDAGGSKGSVTGIRRRRLGQGKGTQRRGYMRIRSETKKETEKSPENARDPLTGRSGGSDRTLPPSVRSIPERSKSSGIGTGRVRCSLTGHRQGPVSTTCAPFDRPDAEPFLTRRTDAASGHSFGSSSPPMS